MPQFFSMQPSHYNDYPVPSANHKLHSEHEWEINAQGNPNKRYQCGHPNKRTVTDLMLKRRLSDKHTWFGLQKLRTIYNCL